MVVLVLLISLLCAPSPLFGQVSWWAEREEPEMLNVTGTLANPEGVSVEFRNPVTQNVRRLMGWEAMVFLQMRNYIVFNEQLRHFQVTAKYNDWKNRPKPVVVQPPVNVPQLQGMPVPLGSTSNAPVQKWQVDLVKQKLWDLYNQVWKPYYGTPPPPKYYAQYAIDVARTIDYHLSTLGTEAQLAWVERFLICMHNCVMQNKHSTNAVQVDCTSKCR